MKLNFLKLGDGEKPLFVLHGLLGSLDNWKSVGKRFADSGYKVFLVDLRNHGRSPHSEIWNYEVMAEDLREMINNELESINIIGHSMGGKVALQFNDLYPGLVDKQIIVDILPKSYSSTHEEIFSALLNVNLERLKSRGEVEDELFSMIQDIGVVQWLLKSLYWKNLENKQLAWRFNLEVISQNLAEASKELVIGRTPTSTLFVKGGLSNYISEGDTQKLDSVFVSYEVEEIKGAGHWVHAQKPVEFFETAISFLQ